MDDPFFFDVDDEKCVEEADDLKRGVLSEDGIADILDRFD